MFAEATQHGAVRQDAAELIDRAAGDERLATVGQRVEARGALMLSRAIEQDRRRGVERRPHRMVQADPMKRPEQGRRRWSLRLPRLGLTGSKA